MAFFSAGLRFKGRVWSLPFEERLERSTQVGSSPTRKHFLPKTNTLAYSTTALLTSIGSIQKKDWTEFTHSLLL